MDFCILSPETGLNRYSTLSKSHLVLCQIENLMYWDFYIKRRNAGDYIILDNGAYEGECNWSRLRGRINRIHPNVVALPDYLAQEWKKTHSAAMAFLDDNYLTYPDIKWMYIPQTEPGDSIGLLKSLYHAMDEPRISWIGLARALCYKMFQDPLMRVKLAERIKHYNPNLKIHALGMNNGSIEELDALRSCGCVDSIDSNAPVWRGWCGYDITAHWPEISVRYDDPNLPDEIFYERAVSKHEQILLNLEACGISCEKLRSKT